MSAKRKPTPKLVDELLAAPRPGPLRWELPAEALADIDDVIAVNKSGRAYISASALARALKDRYALPVKVDTIAGRLRQLNGGRW